jgi:glycosyltransferase involved in cell wall biosynthesis
VRILVSAYACAPRGGSEPGVGWHWAREMAQDHDVWVLTRANNREEIEEELQRSPQPRMRFLYVDLPPWARFWKRGQRGIHLYYYLWQFWARRRALDAHREIRFDLVHHLTFATALVPALTFLPRVPFVWGPVGGGVRSPWRLAPEWGLRGFLFEAVRTIRRGAARYLDPLVRVTWRRATLILVQNPETLAWLPARHRRKCRESANAGIEPAEIGPRVENKDRRFLAITAARLIHWKGISLAIRALAAAGMKDVHLIVAGDGPERARLERLARRLGVETQVEFRGWMERVDLLSVFSRTDVLLFPSMHEDCGAVVIEAMAHGVIPIVLDRGGPPGLTGEAGNVIPINRGSRQEVVMALAGALRSIGHEVGARRAEVIERAQSMSWRGKLTALWPLLGTIHRPPVGAGV